MTKSEFLNILDCISDCFKGLAKREMQLQQDPNLNKSFHEGKEKAYYVAIDVIDDVERTLIKK